MKTPPPPERISLVIRYAWQDRTSFEEIEERTGLTESQVVSVMRRELRPSSFRLWRKRVGGRVTKHRRLLEQHLNGPPDDEDDDYITDEYAPAAGTCFSGWD